MERVERVPRLELVTAAVIAGAYASLSMKAVFLGVPDDVALVAGYLVLAAGAFLARRILRRSPESNRLRRALVLCRRLPLPHRCAGGVGILAAFLLFDRFFDGNPLDYRLFSFVAPVMISTVLFDLRPGMFAVAASSLAVEVFLISPQFGAGFLARRGVIDLVGFVACASLLAFAIQRVVDWRGAPAPRPKKEVDLYRLFGVPRAGRSD